MNPIPSKQKVAIVLATPLAIVVVFGGVLTWLYGA